MRVYEVLEMTSPKDRLSQFVMLFLSAVILLNVAAVVIGTLQPLPRRLILGIEIFEIFTIAVFTVEYILRIWSCTENPRYSHPLGGRVRFALTPLAIVDLIVVLPFYLAFFMGQHLNFLRILRMLRVIRIIPIFKLFRYSRSLQILGSVLKNKAEDLLVAVFIGFVVLMVTSTLMFVVEHQAQPDKFTNMLDAMWWGVETLTTVGYGDIYPVTPLGKIIASVACFLGIGMIAVPASILATGLIEEMQKRKQDPFRHSK
jgi:voltage-gated potassium channel